MTKTLSAFIWFLSLITGSAWVLIPLAIFAGGLWAAFVRIDRHLRRRLWLLAALPLIWIFIGLWGGAFWVEWNKPPVIHNPPWVLYTAQFGILFFLAVAVALIVYLRGARVFAGLFALLNLFFMLFMTFLAGMAVTGTWL